MEKRMFCYQFEQTAKVEGCTRVGVSGKKPEVVPLQDLSIYTLKGLSRCAVEGRRVRVRQRERYSDLSGFSIDLNVLDNIGIGTDHPLAFQSQFNIDAQSLDFLIARKNGGRR